MFKRLIDDLKNAPGKFNQRRTQVVRRARQRAHKVRGAGQIRMWTLQTTTLENLGGLLAKGDEVPVLKVLTSRAGKAINTRLQTVTALPIDDFETITAKAAVSEIRGIDSRVALLNLRRFEVANKARKTVLSAIDKELDKLDELPEQAAA